MPTQQEISLNPTSTKGQILTSNASSRIGLSVGSSSSMILTAMSSASSGLEWKAPLTSSAVFKLISTTTITASTQTVTLSNFSPSSYDHIRLVLSSITSSTYATPILKLNAGQQVRYTRIHRRFGSGTGIYAESPSSPTTIQTWGYGVQDSEVAGSLHVDIFMANVTSGSIGIHTVWSPGAEQVTYPGGAYDSEICYTFSRAPLTRSTLTDLVLYNDAGLAFQSGTFIKLYGIIGG